MNRVGRASLSRRIPLYLALLLSALLGVTTTLEYVQLRALLLGQAEERVRGVTNLLADLFTTSLENGLATMAEAADSLSVALARDGGAPGAAVDSVLAARLRASAQTRAVWYVAAGGSCVRRAGRVAATDSVPAPPRFGPCTGDEELLAGQLDQPLGPILEVDGQPRYTFAAPLDEGGHLAGMAAMGSTEAWSLISNLIASDAQVLLGNRDGSVWTDVEAIVAGPGPGDPLAGRLDFADASGERMGVAAAIGGAPWVVMVHRSRDIILAPSLPFLTRIVASGAVVLALGWLLGWFGSLRITKPLVTVTAGAEAIAGGDYSRRVPLGGDDELGRLADAFNVMAEKVEAGHRLLEDRVTERTRSLEEALARLEEAQEELVRQEKLATLGRLAGGVGHELRNPLGVMTNAVFYLEMVMKDPPPKVAEYLQTLKSQIRMSEKIVSDLLDFARAKPPERVPSNVGALFDRCLEQARVPSTVSVERGVPAQIGLVLVDPDQVGQILSNLVSNAVHAMEESAERRLTLSAVEQNGRVTLSVADTGTGIDSQNLSRVFEPLVTTKARGIGLGLTVSRTLAEANEGRLTVESELGEGTTFHLELPGYRGAPT